MAVPDFQSVMLPLLRMAGDGKEHSLAAVRDTLAGEFGLSDADRSEPLPSGRQGKFSNRVASAKTYLQQAGLLSPTPRGYFRISVRGLDAPEVPPSR